MCEYRCWNCNGMHDESCLKSERSCTFIDYYYYVSWLKRPLHFIDLKPKQTLLFSLDIFTVSTCVKISVKKCYRHFHLNLLFNYKYIIFKKNVLRTCERSYEQNNVNCSYSNWREYNVFIIEYFLDDNIKFRSHHSELDGADFKWSITSGSPLYQSGKREMSFQFGFAAQLLYLETSTYKLFLREFR